ncbi:MAG: DUF3786 domain-containing protein [Ruminiclostridium sp.]|nr:DUF3786 domain-containing protein [Ruminiclostridium sp.]
MESEPDKIKNYSTALDFACKKIKTRDPGQISLNSGTVYDKQNNLLSVEFLNKEYLVNCISGDVSLKDESGEATLWEKVLILHYLINAQNKPLTGELISFREIPNAEIYSQVFHKRVVNPMIRTFSSDTARFYKACEKLGAIKGSYGNDSVTIKVFPLVPVTYVLWDGNDEFAPSGTVLFDRSIDSFLDIEDIVITASLVLEKMIKITAG